MADGDKTIQLEEDLLERQKLACENWNYPVIITTTVQFYETLFSNYRMKCRKFHNIANAVVILDEVQTLNKELALSTLDMLQNIQTVMNTSFVFCSATMPAFEKRDSFAGIEHIVPLIGNPERLFAQTVRVQYRQLNGLQPISLDTLKGSILKSEGSSLVIVNTKKSARKLYSALHDSSQWDRVYHLSTSMCPHHRKGLLKDIHAILRAGRQKILVISTQLVEAGVDLDFPCVFRELSPLESVIQAAGRCNREGAMNGLGQVYLFQLEGAIYPDKSYKTQSRHVYSLLTSGSVSLHDYDFFKEYYKQILGLYITQKDITRERERFNFKTVNEQYFIINNNTQPIFIYNYNEDSKRLYDEIRRKEHLTLKLSRDDYRNVQQYSVQVYENFFMQAKGLYSLLPCGIMVWEGRYDADIGLDIGIQYTDHLII
jgi:CRISPR-associated endonuclease/helicase Cas3